ncbi:MAG TPA: DUF58 domain-containing protein [Planctomycetaceae bacterium]|nr:DUF58 domain-containing protein [Planctomycetaceae bacterium]HIQ20792.1 DUF58 domain-containing protein [Planctomycetota bacterium]
MSPRTGYRYLAPEALARVKNLSLVARGVVEGFISGMHASPYKGFSVEFAEHREYTAGDDPRHLDYKMLARTDRLYIKQYEEETNMRVQILLDTSGSMDYRHEAKITKFQYGAYLTAVLAYLMVRQQDSVGLTTFDTEIRLDMPARSSARHFNEMMRQLEGVSPGDETRIAPTLHKLANRFKRRCLIVLISDLYDDQDEVMRALHHFRHRKHEVIVFNVFDRAEIDFPFRDLVSFYDLETGQRLQVDPVYVRRTYVEQVEQFIEGYRRTCRESNIDYVLTDTSVPYDFMLSKYLAKRNVR